MDSPRTVYLPRIETDPYRGRHVLRWTKPRSLPDMWRQINRENTRIEEDKTTSPVPYRLPRINGNHHPHRRSETDEQNSEILDKVWSRYGYEEPVRVPELGPQVKLLSPPRERTQLFSSLATERRKMNMIPDSSLSRNVPWNVASDFDEIQTYRSMITTRMRSREVSELGGYGRAEPTPSLTSRCESADKSVRSIHWILGSNRHHSFDRKGRSHAQGPFSREFTVTCLPPSKWMKMKWGRSRTTVQ